MASFYHTPFAMPGTPDCCNLMEGRMISQLKPDQMSVADSAIWQDLDVIELCAIETPKGKAVCATPRGSRYPYVYPRDNAQCARALGKLVTYSKNQAIVNRAFALL